MYMCVLACCTNLCVAIPALRWACLFHAACSTSEDMPLDFSDMPALVQEPAQAEGVDAVAEGGEWAAEGGLGGLGPSLLMLLVVCLLFCRCSLMDHFGILRRTRAWSWSWSRRASTWRSRVWAGSGQRERQRPCQCPNSKRVRNHSVCCDSCDLLSWLFCCCLLLRSSRSVISIT
jgi:hypothetical protein